MQTENVKKHHDIIIVGAGIVGLTLACALAQQTHLSLAVIEAQSQEISWSSINYHHRVSAINLASRAIFEKLNLWQEIQEKRASPFVKIHVWDATGHGQIDFSCQDINASELGFIIENNLIQSMLQHKIKQYPNVFVYSATQPKSLLTDKNLVQIETSAGEILTGKLLVAADGARSWVRENAGILLKKQNYHHQAMVATVETALPHQQIASQVFLSTGPLAFLPLQQTNLSSIVWSLPESDAKKYLAMNEADFNHLLAKSFGYKLGEIKKTGERFLFSLYKQQANQYINDRVALIGDAAHVVHPLAGQGVNMGLLDAWCLSQVILQALKNNKDFSSHLVLRRYERWRKADNFAMQTGIDLIKRLFASDKKMVQWFRSTGLNLTNRMTWLKQFFITQASLPEL